MKRFSRTVTVSVLLCTGMLGCDSRKGEDKIAASTAASSNLDGKAIHNSDTESAEPLGGIQDLKTNVHGREASVADEASATAKLEKELSELVIPPPWIHNVTSEWDRSKPWKEARLEIRRLLGIGDQSSRHEALRLMWDYKSKGDMGDGHEYSMYTFLGDESLWAIQASREWMENDKHEYPPDFCIKSLAVLYADRGMFFAAEAVLNKGIAWPPADATWRQAEYLDAMGDLYVAWDRMTEAKNCYKESISIYPKSNPPYGQHLIPRRVRKVQGKLDLLSQHSLADAMLKDGVFRDTVLGYSGDVEVIVEVDNGRLSRINVKHEEKIDQGATKIIPERIVAEQRLQVDGITGATITKDAIVTGALNALKQAGLE